MKAELIISVWPECSAFAAQDLQRALQLVSDAAEQAEIQLELGVVLRRQRDYRQSVRACRTALDADRANPQVRMLLGRCMYALRTHGDRTTFEFRITSTGQLGAGVAPHAQAGSRLAIVSEMTTADSSRVQAWHNLGLGLLSLGDLDDSAGAFHESLRK